MGCSMETTITSDSLLFNEAFLRAVMVIPLVIGVGITIKIWKQYKYKFRHRPLINQDK